jgi:hypothetical protein
MRRSLGSLGQSLISLNRSNLVARHSSVQKVFQFSAKIQRLLNDFENRKYLLIKFLAFLIRTSHQDPCSIESSRSWHKTAGVEVGWWLIKELPFSPTLVFLTAIPDLFFGWFPKHPAQKTISIV